MNSPLDAQDPANQDLAVGDLAAPAAPPLVDAAGLSAQVDRITGVEQAWTLPPLPNNVKLDLIAHPSLPNADAVGSFLYGIHDDMNQTVTPAAATPSLQYAPTLPDAGASQQQAASQPVQIQPLNTQPVDPAMQLRKVWHGLAGLAAPEVTSGNAVENMKIRAVQAGLLPATTPIDGSWDPQLHYVSNDLAYQDFSNRIVGARPGAVRTNSVMDLLTNWTSPSHLLSGAVSLGFLPNVEAIKNNVKDFGDSHNPLDLLKAGANIALPVLNDVLLFTGVSEVAAFGRGAMLGAEGLKGLELANEVAKGGSLLGRTVGVGADAGRFGIDAGDVAAEVGRFGSRGWIAEHAPSAIGDQLAQWKQSMAGLIAKKAVQQGMKLGVAGQLETTLFPDLSGVGITGAGSQKDRAASTEAALRSNAWTGGVATALELPLMPPSIFRPGTFTGPASALAQWATKATTAVADDSKITGVVHALLSNHYQATDPAMYQKYTEAFRKDGAKAAIVATLGGGDPQVAGEIMTHLTVTAALNQRANADSVALGLQQGSRAYDEAFHIYRNRYINQLRPFDFNLENQDEVVRYAQARSKIEFEQLLNPEKRDGLKGLTAARDQKFASISAGLSSEDETVRNAAIAEAHDAITAHNAGRSAALGSLLGDLTPDSFAQHVTDAWDRVNPEQWQDFVGGQRQLEELYALNDLKFIDARSPGDWDWRQSSFADNIPADLTATDLKGNWHGGKGQVGLDAFGGTIDPLKGHFALAKADTLSRQQAASVIGYARTLLTRQTSLRADVDGTDTMFARFGRQILSRLGGAEPGVATDEAATAGAAALQTAKPSDLKQTVSDLYPPGQVEGVPRAALKNYADTLRWVAKQGGDPAAALDHVNGQIDALSNAGFWADQRLANTSLPLHQRVDALEQRLPFIAGEVQIPDAVRLKLAAKGYKAVYGPDFLYANDLTGLNGPFGDLNRAQMRRLSLGTFASNADPMIPGLQEDALRRNLTATMADTPAVFHYGAATPAWAPDSADVEDIVRQLRGEMASVRQTAGMVDEQRGGALRNVAAALHNSWQPHTMYDLHPSRVRELFSATYGEKGANLITGALRDAAHLGWQYQGLGAIESRLRANSWLASSLKVLGKSSAGDSLKEWQGFKRAGVGVLSGALALAQGANPAVAAGIGVAGAGVAPAFAALPRPVALGVAGAAAAAAPALAAGADPMGALKSAAIGGAVGGGIGLGASKAFDIFSDRGWGEYSKLADGLVRLRDNVRFSLNPFFDARRIAKTMIRSGIADLPEGYTLPVQSGLDSYAGWGGFAKSEQGPLLERFRAATQPWMDSEKVDEMARFTTDRGILGFSPTRQMAGAFGHLVGQGMDDEQAANLVRQAFTYGGRTGLEKSVNFVFFPFSFEKKVIGQMAHFLSDDLGRTVVLHDAMKAYDVLNDRYDLSSKLEEHMPILHDLQKLNMFTNGLSLGELGGVNRPLIEGFQSTPMGGAVDQVLNMFLPQQMQIDHTTDIGHVQATLSRMVPAYNDISYLLKDAAQQGHVVFSPSHMTDAAETSNAYAEWDGFKKQVSAFAAQQGATYDQFMRSPKYAPIKAYIEQQRALIGQKYPAWADARANAAGNATQLNSALADITANPRTVGEQELAQFADVVDRLDSSIRKQSGVSFKNTPDAVPPEFYDAVRNLALAFTRQGNGFDALYARYFAPTFGPISEPVT